MRFTGVKVLANAGTCLGIGGGAAWPCLGLCWLSGVLFLYSLELGGAFPIFLGIRGEVGLGKISHAAGGQDFACDVLRLNFHRRPAMHLDGK